MGLRPELHHRRDLLERHENVPRQGRGHRPGPAGGDLVNAARKGVAAVLTVGLAALAMWLYDIKPGLESRMLHPLMAKGHVGAAVDTPEFSVKVGKVDVASA